MPVLAKPLVEVVQLAAAETTQYTAGPTVRTIIDKCTATNVSAGNVVVTVRLVPFGAVAGANNAITYQKTLTAGDPPYAFPEIVGHILAPGDFVSTLAGTAAAVNFRMSGREVTQ